MKRGRQKHLISLAVAAFIVLVSTHAFAIDPPHTSDVYGAFANKTCSRCHDASNFTGLYVGGSIDNTPYNMMCKSCHDDTKAKLVNTHSSLTTQYETAQWTYQCTSCHNPHTQTQRTRWKTQTYLQTGTIQSLISNGSNTYTITVNGSPNWKNDKWVGYKLIPYVNYPTYLFQIVKNTSNTLIIKGLPTRYRVGGQYAILYGMLVKDRIMTGKMVNGSTIKDVKLFNDIGPYSTAPMYSNPNDKSVCVICHTNTKYMNIADIYAGTVTDHYPSKNESCFSSSSCHRSHDEGFQIQGACDTCHGSPPLSNTPGPTGLVYNGMYPDGVAKAVTTGPVANNVAAAGHNYHNNVRDFDCDVCHRGGMFMAGTTTNDNMPDDRYLDLGFNYLGDTNGIFYGRSDSNLHGGYNYNGTAGGHGLHDDSLTCSNLYCHSNANYDYSTVGGSRKYATPAWDGGAQSCNSCHSAPGDGTRTWSTSHDKHTRKASDTTKYDYNCNNCHSATASNNSTISSQANHVNKVKNVVFNSVNPTGSYTASTRTCNNTYCHSNANPLEGTNQYQTPTWADFGSVGCTSCHDDAGATTTLSVKHQTHTGQYNMSCTKCHNDTVSSDSAIKNTTLHVNKTKNVAFNATNPSGTFTLLSHECNNLYCHSNANPVGGTNGYKTVYWNDAAFTSCDKCHESAKTLASMQAAGAAGLSNTHEIHVATDRYGAAGRGTKKITCASCHNDTTLDGTNVIVGNHVNAAKNVKLASGWPGGTHSGSGATLQCNNVYCHSDGNGAYGSTQWGTVSSGACGTCHKQDETLATGAHSKHVGTGSGKVYQFECYKCHKDIVTPTSDSTVHPAINDRVKHADNTKDVVFNTADAVIGASATRDGSGTCSSLYCHSMGKTSVPVANLPAEYGGSHYTAMDWSDPATTCNSCHGKSQADGRPDYESGGPNKPDSNSHIEVTTHGTTDCSVCHSQTVASGSSPVTSDKHVNSQINVAFSNGSYSWNGGDKTCTLTCHINNYAHSNSIWGNAGCTGCHGQPPVNNATLINAVAGAVTGRSSAFPGTGSGKHEYHYTTKNLNDCNYCHEGAGAIGNHNDGTKKVHMGFSAFGQKKGFYQAPSFLNGYTIFSGNAGTTVSTAAGARVCSNIYCHSDGGDFGGTTTYKFADWDDSGVSCSYCHGSGNAYATANAHPTHATTYAFKCYECHNDTVDINNAVTGNHVNNVKNIAWGPMNQDGTSGETCTNLYCHSQGTNNAATYANPNTTPSWDGTLADCDDCHSGDSSAGFTMSTNKHAGHINNATKVGRNIECDECHAATVSSGNRTISASTRASHVNRKVNVKFDGAVNLDADSPTYNGASTTGAGGYYRNPGNSAASCNNVYCHSTGNPDETRTYKSIAWNGGAIGCDGCHGGSGKSHASTDGASPRNSHVKHVESSSFDCYTCHTLTTTDSAIPPTSVLASGAHINRIENVAFKSIGGQTGTYNANYTCSNTYCHGTWSQVTWGQVNSLQCSECHQSQGGGTGSATYTSSHQKHTETAGYKFACEDCHTLLSTPKAYHANGPAANPQTTEIFFSKNNGSRTYGGGATSYIYNNLSSNAYNGTAVTPTYAAGGSSSGTDSANSAVTWTSGTCNNVWCHSNASPYGKAGSYASVTWGATLPSDCTGCHGGAAASASVGLSTKHATHVATDKYSFRCVECHSSTVGVSNTTVTNKANHVDGQKDVAFYTSMRGSGVDQSGGTSSGAGATRACNNIYCHSDGKDGATGNVTNWGGTTTCTTCHGGDSSGTLTARHTKHAASDNYNFGCGECHSKTMQGIASDSVLNTTNGYQYHVNGIKNIAFYASMRGTGTDQTGGSYNNTANQCSNLYCHSNVQAPGGNAGPTVYKTPDWDDASTGACGQCHAKPPASGRHAVHTGAPYEYDCLDCHRAGGPQTGFSNHMNGKLDMVINTAYGAGSYSQGSHKPGAGGYGTCSTTYCHGTVSPNWGTDLSSYNNCTICHGAKTTGADGFTDKAAPGVDGGTDTGNVNTATDTEVGAHSAHLKADSLISNPIACGACHTVPGSVLASGHIDNSLPAEVKFSGIALLNASNASYNYTTGDCSNVYCHNQAKFRKTLTNPAWYNAIDNTPTWNQTAFLTSPMDATDCSKCHGYPPKPSHSTSIDCSACHDHVDPDDLGFSVLANRAKHLDGIVQGAGTCDACHGYPPRSNAGSDIYPGGRGQHWTFAADGAHIDNSALNAQTDQYGKSGGWATECSKCHLQKDASHPENDGRADVLINTTSYKFSTGGTPAYKSDNTCTNVSCHFQATPKWSCP